MNIIILHKAKTIIVNKVSMMYDIINRLEKLYSDYLVYRTIIVCDNNNIDKYLIILKENNYDSYVLKEYDDAIDYDSLDTRIFLIEKGNFIEFIEKYIENKNRVNVDIDIHRYGAYFYNSIIIQFENDNDNDNDIIGETERIKRKYKEISNNYDIII